MIHMARQAEKRRQGLPGLSNYALPWRASRRKPDVSYESLDTSGLRLDARRYFFGTATDIVKLGEVFC